MCRLKRFGDGKIEPTSAVRRAGVAMVAACMGVFGLVACDDVDTVVIGAVLPLTGPAAYVGEEIRDGMSLAVDQVNASGGINGQPVSLMVADATGAENAAQEAFDIVGAHDPVVTVAGTSAVAMALKDHAERERRLLVGLVAAAPSLTTGVEWVYRYWPAAAQEVPPMATILAADIEQVAVIYLDDPYGASVKEALSNRLAGEVELSNFPFPIAQTEFANLAHQAAESAAIVLVGFDTHIRAALRALRELDYQGTIVSTTTATLPTVTTDPVADGIQVVAPAIYNPNYLFADEVRSRYEDQHDKPFNQYAGNGYDFVTMLAGLLDGHKVTPEEAKARFDDGFMYSGIFGNVSLEEGRNEMDFPLFPAVIRDGRILYQ